MTQFFNLRPHKWHLLISPSPKRLLVAITHLAHNVELTIFDCGRRFDSSVVARAARGRKEIINNVKIQRTFTCFEAVKLLEQKQLGKTPVIVLDFLSTFYDENVKINTRNFLLEKSLRHFQRLSQFAGLAVSVYMPASSGNSVSLLERLQSAAPSVSNYTVPEQESSQLGFF